MRSAMKSVATILVVLISLVRVAEADASSVWTTIGESAPRSAFDAVRDTAPLKSERLDDQFDSELASTVEASCASEN